MKVAFCTLGCKVNQYETNVMIKQFEEKNEIVDFDDIADVYVINSCSVTNLSTRKTRQMVSRARKRNEKAIVALVGCYAQELTFSQKYHLEQIGADVILGNEEKKDIVPAILEYIPKKNGQLLKVSSISSVKKYIQKDQLQKGMEIRESIKIEDGCNNFCSYCIIPYTRGRVRSRLLSDIVEEVGNVARSGTKEIVLVGIEIASYGIDFDKNISLIDVIEKISEIKGVERIRLGSIEPRWLTDEMIARLTKIDKLCPHFHLSVQSLNNSVLQRMNRHYTKEFVFDVVNKLRKSFMQVGITCDMIVGYIDETEKEFLDSYQSAKEICFQDMHVFKFSKREHTRAYDLDSSVTEEEKNKRSNIMMELALEMKEKILRESIGKSASVLLEECHEGMCYGYTPCYKKVKVKGDKSLCQTVQEIEFTCFEKGMLVGN